MVQFGRRADTSPTTPRAMLFTYVSCRFRTNPVTVALTLTAATVALSFLVVSGRNGTFAIDLRHAFLPAARNVLHGRSPYPGADQLSFTDQTAYVYPPLAAVLLAPFAWLPSVAVALV